MSGYESDSSNDDFQETNVLLGYASQEADGDVVSRLGGQPDWLDPDAPPTAGFARCKVCKSMMVLLLQLNGELPDQFPNHERRLYVFSCRNASCRRKEGSVRALRATRIWKEEKADKVPEAKKDAEDKPAEKKPEGPALGNALFGGGGAGANPFASNANPFSTPGSAAPSNPFSTSSVSANPFSAGSEKPKAEEEEPAKEAEEKLPKTFAETLSLNNKPTAPPPPPEAWPTADALPHPYPTLYLADADYETLEPEKKEVPENARMESADAAEPSGLDKEAFESSMDATFQKFADRMSQNPEQCIRYERGGQPLLYSKLDAVGAKLTKSTMPGCANCGGRRTFEVQMTPHAITELEADDMSLDGMEWGTIIVGACERDCVPNGTELGQAGYVEEWAGVQWEELSKTN